MGGGDKRLEERPWKRMTFMPSKTDLDQPPFSALKLMLDDARLAMGRADIEMADVAILASSGAENQPPHTDLPFLDRSLRRLNLKNKLVFAAVKNIHDTGTKSGTIMIDGSNSGWNGDGFDHGPLLQNGGSATRTRGDCTLTTYIDHRTIHFGEAVPEKKEPNDWKLTAYALMVQADIMERFTKVHDKTRLYTPFEGLTVLTIEDKREEVTYLLHSANRKQKADSLTLTSSSTFREIRRMIAEKEDMLEGFLQIQWDTGAIPELSHRLGDPQQRKVGPCNCRLKALDTEGITRRRNPVPTRGIMDPVWSKDNWNRTRKLEPLKKRQLYKEVTVECLGDRSQSITVQTEDTLHSIEAKIQEVVLLPAGTYTATYNSKDLRSLPRQIFDTFDENGTIRINGRIRGAGGVSATHPDSCGTSDEDHESDEKRSPRPGRKNAFAAYRKKVIAKQDKESKSKRMGKRHKHNRKHEPIQVDSQHSTKRGNSYNTGSDLTFDIDKAGTIQELKAYLKVMLDSKQLGQDRHIDQPTFPRMRSLEYTSDYDLKIVISPPRAGRRGTHVVLRSTGTLCGVNISQTNMYDLKVACNDVQRRLSDRGNRPRLDRKTITQKADKLLRKARKKGTAPQAPIQTHSEDESQSPDDSPQSSVQAESRLQDLPCGNSPRYGGNRKGGCPSTNMKATFRCSECRHPVCEMCREDDQHKDRTPHCRFDTWEPTPDRSRYFTNHRLAGKIIMNKFKEIMTGRIMGGYEDEGETWVLVDWKDGQEQELDEELFNDCRHAYETYEDTGEEPETDLLEGHLFAKEERKPEAPSNGAREQPRRPQRQNEKKGAQPKVSNEERPLEDRKVASISPVQSPPKPARAKNRSKAKGRSPQAEENGGLRWLTNNIETDQKQELATATKRRNIMDRHKAALRLQKEIAKKLQSFMRCPKEERPMIKNLAELTYDMMACPTNQEIVERIRESACTLTLNAAHELTGEPEEDTILKVCRDVAKRTNQDRQKSPRTPKKRPEPPQRISVEKTRAKRQQQPEDTCGNCQEQKSGGNFCQNCGKDQRLAAKEVEVAAGGGLNLQHLLATELPQKDGSLKRRSEVKIEPKNHGRKQKRTDGPDKGGRGLEEDRLRRAALSSRLSHQTPKRRIDDTKGPGTKRGRQHQSKSNTPVRNRVSPTGPSDKIREGSSTIRCRALSIYVNDDLNRMRWTADGHSANAANKDGAASYAAVCDQPLLYSDSEVWRLRNNRMSDFHSIASITRTMNSREGDDREYMHALIFYMPEGSTRTLDTGGEGKARTGIIMISGQMRITVSEDRGHEETAVLRSPDAKEGRDPVPKVESVPEKNEWEVWELDTTGSGGSPTLRIQLQPMSARAIWIELRPGTGMQNKVCSTRDCNFKPCAFSNQCAGS
jgi:hypothetical protein